MILDIVSYVAIACIVLLAVLSLMLSVTTKRESELPRLFGSTVMLVESDSMKGSKSDNFKKGDLVKVEVLSSNADKAKLKVGDIITFKFDRAGNLDGGQEFNTHRIHSLILNEDGEVYGFKTKGDNNTAVDADSVYFPDIVGKYNGHLSGLGAFMGFLKSTAGFIVLIILPLVLFAGYRVYILVKIILDIKKEKNKDKQPLSEEDQLKLLKELEELKAKVAGTAKEEAVEEIAEVPAEVITQAEPVAVATEEVAIPAETITEAEVAEEIAIVAEPVAEAEVAEVKAPKATAKPANPKATAPKATTAKTATAKPATAKATAPKATTAKPASAKATPKATAPKAKATDKNA